MHEWSIAEDMLSTIERSLGHKTALAAVHLTLGPVSGVCAESLDFCFAEVANQKGFGTPRLVIHAVPAEIRCSACEHVYAVKNFFEPCPQCGSMERSILSGRECFVESVELPETCDA